MTSTHFDDETLYQALIARDGFYDGRAYVGVTTTGIFCRLTCPARKPKRENCAFFETVTACLDAGFRPCRRCRPLENPMAAAPMVKTLINILEQQPGRRWRETDLIGLGFDPSTVRRAFKRHFGVTFLAMARLARVRSGVQALASGGRVIDAQLAAGYESGSGFRAALARIQKHSGDDSESSR